VKSDAGSSSKPLDKQISAEPVLMSIRDIVCQTGNHY